MKNDLDTDVKYCFNFTKNARFFAFLIQNTITQTFYTTHIASNRITLQFLFKYL